MAKFIDGVEMEYVDILPLPFLNTDLEVSGTYPAVVEAFRQKILAADGIFFASPEYNYSVSGTKFTIVCLSSCVMFVILYTHGSGS